MRRLAAACWLLAFGQATLAAGPELNYDAPQGFYRSATTPPEDYSANDVNAGLQVYPFRPAGGDVEQAFRRTLLRDWIDPRFREANVASTPEFRAASVPGASSVVTARFTENVAGMTRQRQRVLIVAGNAAAILDAWAASPAAWQELLPRLNAMWPTLRVDTAQAAPPAAAGADPRLRAVAGLYAGIKTNYIPNLMGGVGSGSHVPTPHYYLFSADGRVYRAYDGIAAPLGAERFDFRAAARSDPVNSGTYGVEGGGLRLRMGSGSSAETIVAPLPRGGRVTIHSVEYTRQ